ncbi:helix-turn-helix domain-containing protein, partial [Burkholderia multivorans]
MSEPQPSNGAETNAAQPAPAGLESLVAVGSRLAQLREAKGWTVEDVSARLKVAPPKLRALEAGDISHLP